MNILDQSREKRIRTLTDDPQYFGGYLNMARHNIFSISNHVAQKFGLKLLQKVDMIADSFLGNMEIKDLNWNHIFSTTTRFMPLLKVFDFEQLPKSWREKLDEEERVPEITKDFNRMKKVLRELFKEIGMFRNDYSHYFSTLEGANRKVEVSPLTADFLKETFYLAIEFTKVRMKDVLKDEDYDLVEKLVIVDDSNKITTEGLVFFICIFLEREQAFQFIGKVKGLKGTQYSTFIATREVLMAFSVKLPHDKFVSEDLKPSLTLDMINELARCPKTLHEVITEEAKRHFRPELDMEKRQRIIENSINELSSEDWSEPSYDEYIEQLTKRVRYNNRFAYFAMRFIDEMAVFRKLRFHIDLGKLELAKYDKELAGSMEMRRVVENVKAFGKLSDYMYEKESFEKVDPNGITSGFEQFAPCYNMKNNKIGLLSGNRTARLIEKTNSTPGETSKIPYKLAQPQPVAFLSLHELPKIILLEYFEKGETEKIIEEFISLNRDLLLDRGFIEKVKSRLPGDWDSFKKWSDSKKQGDSERERKYLKMYIKKLQNRKNELNKVLKEFGMNDKQIPTRILNYWLNISDVDRERSFSDRVKLMKRDSMDRLKVMKKRENNPAVRTSKVGEMATFLAKDIVDMVINLETKKRITSFYYDKMQECLAFYADPEKKDLFSQLIKELGLLDMGGHPFLLKVMGEKPYNTAQFYTIYLTEKANKEIAFYNTRKQKSVKKDESWMMTTFYKQEWNENARKKMTVVRLPEDTSGIPFTIRQWAEKEKHDLKVWLDNVTKDIHGDKKPIDLPTNLFDERLRELLGETLKEAGVEYDSSNKYNELLKLWWEIRGDRTQDFYRSERAYKIYGEVVNFVPDTKPRFEDYYNIAFEKVKLQNKEKRVEQTDKQLKRVFKHAIAETEKEIRMLQEEDLIVLLMIETMGRMNNVKLSEIDTLLNETITASLTLNYDNQGKSVADNQTTLMTKTIVSQYKRKNHTRLRKYRYDRRLYGLLGYHPDEEVQLEWLKVELASYEKAKQDVMDMVFELEEWVIKQDEEGLKELFIDSDGNIKSGNIQHNPYLEWLIQSGMINEEERTFLKTVRNSFLHNQFPNKKDIGEHVIWTDNVRIAEQIAEVYTNKIKGIIDNVPQVV